MLIPPPPAIIWQAPEPQLKDGTVAAYTCDESGVIHCSTNDSVTVTANRTTEDIRIIAKYISLVAERNRRYYSTWQQKLPAAAYEVVRRVRQFPFLPYGDMYAITDMRIILEQGSNKITVRYLKDPQTRKSELTDDDFATYQTNLSSFIKTIESEIGKLKKYDTSKGGVSL